MLRSGVDLTWVCKHHEKDNLSLILQICTLNVDFNIYVNIMNNQMLLGYLEKCLLHVDAYFGFVTMLKCLFQ